MRIAFTAEQDELRQELREYFAGLMTPEVQQQLVGAEGEYGTGDVYRSVVRQMGQDGWLGIGWPREYGGQNRSMVEQLIFTDEASLAGAPVPFLTINTVGPTLMEHGTEEQRHDFLPRILRGELHFAIGYSEPDAGTDLASLKTKAVRDGDEWVINGQKMWTSLIQYADYVWLAARTDPDAPKHKGLSVFLVPTSADGFSWSPVRTVSGVTTSQTFYEDVRVPESALVGELNGGWRLVTGQLNRERVALTSAAGIQHLLADTVRWAQQTKTADGRRVIDREWVQINLGKVHAKVEFLKLINWKIAWGVSRGLNPADASATKVFGTEFYTEAYRLLMEVVGEDSYLQGSAPGVVLRGRLERMYRSTLILTFGGGTNEVQRDIVAMVGLGLPEGAALMDFAFSDDQLALGELARKIFEGHVGHDSLTALEAAGGPRFDPKLWRALADANLLGIAVAENLGGLGLGVIEQCVFLREAGRTLAPVPVVAATMSAAAVAVFGTDALQDRWAGAAVRGEAILTAALAEPLNVEPERPSTTARRYGTSWRLDGTKTAVPAATIAQAILVPAVSDDGARVFVVEADRDGVTIEPQTTTNKDQHGLVTLDGVAVDDDAILGGDEVLAWLLDHVTVGLCAVQLGVTERALEAMAAYTKERVQFDRPIATFQAVGHRCADAYIDVEGIRLTLWQAAWRLSEGVPARAEVETAKFWAADGGHRVAHAVVHVHGGMGVATEYTAHRYFIHAKQIELTLGGATEQALRIGAGLATSLQPGPA